MINIIKEWIRKIKDYDRLQTENLLLNDELSEIVKDNEEIQKEINNLVSENDKLKKKEYDVMDSEYWNNRWNKNKVVYKAPYRKDVREYVNDREIEDITLISEQLIKNNNVDNLDDIPLIVMKWIVNKKFKYLFDPSEYWNTPEETLSKVNDGTDCDDLAILEYYIIRKILKILGKWEDNKHRMKLWDGRIYHPGGQILRSGGRHLSIIWLAKNTEWYTVEGTWYIKRAINSWLKKPMKNNRMYGVTNFTFNDSYSWAEKTLLLDKREYEKVKI